MAYKLGLRAPTGYAKNMGLVPKEYDLLEGSVIHCSHSNGESNELME